MRGSWIFVETSVRTLPLKIIKNPSIYWPMKKGEAEEAKKSTVKEASIVFPEDLQPDGKVEQLVN